MIYSKYYLYKKQVSNDNGVTWEDVTPLETAPSGESIGSYSTLEECSGSTPPPTPEPQYRTTSGSPYCSEYDKYVDVYSQVSYDSGSTWTTTATTPTMIEHNSEDCGYVPTTGQYLTFVATQNGTFTFNPENSNVIYYSTDEGSTWTKGSSVSVSANDKVLWKGTMTPSTSYPNCGIGVFSSTSNFTVEGNPMSLLYGDNFQNQTSLSGKNYAFWKLFSGCTRVTSAENMVLPATTLSYHCYSRMFKDCPSLTTAPQLPATTLTDGCYSDMFYNCTSLSTAPELPATTLVNNCYYGMFLGCTSLTTAPNLPATTLALSCYRYIFSGCTSLNTITCFATDISADYCTNNWVNGVAASGTFTKAANMSGWGSCGTSKIPCGWTIQDAT